MIFEVVSKNVAEGGDEEDRHGKTVEDEIRYTYL
jgi:hypothetical protein